MRLAGKVIVVTGGSAGIGLAIVKECALRGAHVVSVSRRAKTGEVQPFGTGDITFLAADVTQNADFAASEVFRLFGRADALVNAAGNGIAGAVEDTSLPEARFQMETNFFGAAAMTASFLPLLRASRGMLLNIGSVAALFGIPFQGYYSAGKFALDGLTEALRNEMRPFGVRVCVLEPGDTKTDFTASRKYTEKTLASPVYRKEFCNAVGSMAASELQGMPPAHVGRIAANLLESKNPPLRRVVGFYRLLAFAKRLLPQRLISWALYQMYNRASYNESVWSFEKDVAGREAKK